MLFPKTYPKSILKKAYNASRQVVYSVVSGAQTRKVIAAVRKVDPGAFINSIKTSEVRGNFYQNPKD